VGSRDSLDIVEKKKKPLSLSGIEKGFLGCPRLRPVITQKYSLFTVRFLETMKALRGQSAEFLKC
jgi:hypothetical protein